MNHDKPPPVTIGAELGCAAIVLAGAAIVVVPLVAWWVGVVRWAAGL